jgi:ABC-2 type transport system ATP-binding protein
MPVLEFKDVNKVLRSGFLRRPVYRLGPLSLDVEPGEIFGYLGPNGAGKTTSIKIAMGIIRADSGEVRLFGMKSDKVAVRKRVGFLPEHPYFYQHLTAFELLDFYGHLFGIDGRMRRRRARHLLEVTGLGRHAGTRLSKFSKGMLQRAGFAQALVNDPDIVVLDEPLSGLDPAGRRQIRDLIAGLKSSGKTVFFSSHILQDVEMICDRVGILLDGRLLAAATMEDILSETLTWVEITFDGRPAYELMPSVAGDREEKAGRRVLRLRAEDDPDEAIRAITAAGGRIISVIPQRRTLEDYFMINVEARRDTAGSEPAAPRGPAREGAETGAVPDEVPVEDLAARGEERKRVEIGMGN